jgi:hypothetical protein
MSGLGTTGLIPTNIRGIQKVLTNFDQQSLTYTIIAMILIVMVKLINKFYIPKDTRDVTNWFTFVLFAVGYLALAFAISISGQFKVPYKTLLAFIAAGGVLFSEYQLEIIRKSDRGCGVVLPIIHAISWLTLGFTMGLGHSRGFIAPHTIIGLVAAGMMIFENLSYCSPKIAKFLLNIIQVIFPIAPWTLLVIGNSIKLKGL